MSDWLTYTPETFLMFSERTYRRLFESHNAALWPAHLAVVLAAAVVFVMLFRRAAQSGRLIALALALAWMVVALAWFWTRFSTIHTGASIMAAAFAFEGLALLWFGAIRSRLEIARPTGAFGWAGTAILTYGLLLQPLLGRALGRPWAQSEVFGLAPDPTVAATIGALLLARRAPWFLWTIPVGWSLFSGLTLWAMHAPDAWLPSGIAIAGTAPALASRWRRKQRTPLNANPGL
ncbi:MAG TPA: DUF6064 family protein [Opitutaceae bacterium]|nr:DUF6064 family protein [Opitutaceae bacterium]